MKHIKTYYKRTLDINGNHIIVEGPVDSKTLKQYTFDSGLVAFRMPSEQFIAIQEIADLEEGRIIICRDKNNIIGYTTYLYPDPLERWSDGQLPYLLELGAIEISADYRAMGLGKAMLELSMLDDMMEDYIIITTEYYWHWDLKNSGLDVFEYKKIMQKMMAAGGMEVFSTDDPEITSHPANCLMARIGNRITNDQIQAFDNIRFQNRFFL
ncbi:GNAT family N-acetyltransferase [Macrococcus armenti]|uniref:GNAT family N-acetyltransferase n=1 Tax=Macrococcus armenti TaxID=2875764 RepID=UPI001CCA2B53|nr:GNAT family N-acetyltransferase [Macrococcus armenti]UBH14693.1 GNAT family N-acetyltransferase [Macrococcus armenti]UBH17052.1 GNAT family N-acetyltransferase [Macrococcus armenti]UBH19318.1 GNAT family N-acetyltransferase [Macrococcus armenti]